MCTQIFAGQDPQTEQSGKMLQQLPISRPCPPLKDSLVSHMLSNTWGFPETASASVIRHSQLPSPTSEIPKVPLCRRLCGRALMFQEKTLQTPNLCTWSQGRGLRASSRPLTTFRNKVESAFLDHGWGLEKLTPISQSLWFEFTVRVKVERRVEELQLRVECWGQHCGTVV